MWLNLAKVTPALLAEIRERPALLDVLFLDEGADLPDGFDERRDVFGCDYRTLSAVAEAMADQERPGADWRDLYPWLRRATGDEGADHLTAYEFTYGPAFLLTVEDVVTVHRGLTEEGWAFVDDVDDLDAALPDDARPDTGSDNIDDDEIDDEQYEFDDFDEIVPFFAAAVREG